MEETKKPHVAGSRKRAYEHDEHKPDVTMEKIEDPAYANKLQYYGLKLARGAALDNLIKRLNRQYEAYMAGRPFNFDQ